MPMFVLDTDAYGSRGQLSLMADFFEFCCTTRRLRLTHKVVQDYLFDRGIRIPRHERVPLDAKDAMIGDGLLDDDDAGSDHTSATDARRRHAEEDATRVLAMIQERERYLGAAYPFRLRDGKTLIRPSKEPVAYDVVLTLALRHGCIKDVTAAIEFEGFVARCLAARHWRVFALGAEVRAAPGTGAKRFQPVFRQLSKHLRLRQQNNLTVPKHVHDRGADVIVRWEPVDDRPGCRTMLVQVTVGKANTWAGKAAEPPTGAWKEL